MKTVLVSGPSTHTLEQKESNKEKLKTRARVEHVFGFMEQSINGLIVRGDF